MTSELEQDGGLAPQAMLTVSAVARRLGVAPSTLRTWDRRYGLGPSAHTAGSHRRYGPDDLSRLVVMRGLVMEGVPPAEAAQIALGAPVGAEPVPVSERPAGVTEVAGAGAGAGPAWAGRTAGRHPARPGVGLPAGAPPLAGQSFAAVWSGGPAAGQFPVTSHPVPVSRGPFVDGPPLPGGPHAEPARSDAPEGSGRAVWPVSPLAARHLLAAVEGAVAPSGRPAGVPGGPGEALDPGVLDRAVLDPGALEAAGRDAALASLLDEALRRPGPAGATPWVAPTARAGGGRVISLPDASPRARGLARAAMSLDTQGLTRLLRDAVASYGVIGTWNSMVLPVLKGLGDRWEATGDGVDVEHAFSEATVGVLRGVTASLHRPRNVRPVLLACADGDHHTLPLHVLAAALSEVEIGCRMLGVGLPASSLAAAIRRTGPAVVFVYARLSVPDGAVLQELPRQRPAPRVLVGGSGWDDVDLPASVGHVASLQSAVDEVRAAVHL